MTDQERYQKEKESHEDFIRGYQACINDTFWITKETKSVNVNQLLERLNSEKSKRESMDAPNEPGYFRANND